MKILRKIFHDLFGDEEKQELRKQKMVCIVKITFFDRIFYLNDPESYLKILLMYVN